jgi:hypothetical protein
MIKKSYYPPNPLNRSCAASRDYKMNSVCELSIKKRVESPVCKSGYPSCPRLAIRQYTPENAFDVEGWTGCAGQDDVT